MLCCEDINRSISVKHQSVESEDQCINQACRAFQDGGIDGMIYCTPTTTLQHTMQPTKVGISSTLFYLDHRVGWVKCISTKSGEIMHNYTIDLD